MQIRTLLLLFLFGFVACKNKSQDVRQEKFDKIKWATKNGNEYPYRDKMLKDLLANYKWNGVKRDSVLHLLGQPNRTDTNYFFYTVIQPYLANMVPLYTKSLVIKFGTDSTVAWRKIHE